MIANWDAVPHQAFDGVFEIGVVAFHEHGTEVAFTVDGECAPVAEEFATFQRTLAAGRLHPKGIRDLEAVLVEHEAELRAFAGL